MWPEITEQATKSPSRKPWGLRGVGLLSGGNFLATGLWVGVLPNAMLIGALQRFPTTASASLQSGDWKWSAAGAVRRLSWRSVTGFPAFASISCFFLAAMRSRRLLISFLTYITFLMPRRNPKISSVGACMSPNSIWSTCGMYWRALANSFTCAGLGIFAICSVKLMLAVCLT